MLQNRYLCAKSKNRIRYLVSLLPKCEKMSTLVGSTFFRYNIHFRVRNVGKIVFKKQRFLNRQKQILSCLKIYLSIYSKFLQKVYRHVNTVKSHFSDIKIYRKKLALQVCPSFDIFAKTFQNYA